ncbi:hypothetical protein DJ018_06540 [Phenylobacterium deserti]|uniref:DUF2474 domain-containing protein n=1 Tax=Phenylobacterium deserti TaxID=1914756 RepID=A0A328ARB7_9CAUL|nr:hypothetical protein DJ018_06540 [Phenylobacterium deserti]
MAQPDPAGHQHLRGRRAALQPGVPVGGHARAAARAAGLCRLHLLGLPRKDRRRRGLRPLNQRLRRLLWFVGLYLASLLTFGAAVYLFRALIHRG